MILTHVEKGKNKFGFAGRLIKYQINMILTHVERRGKNIFGFAGRLTKYQILAN